MPDNLRQNRLPKRERLSGHNDTGRFFLSKPKGGNSSGLRYLFIENNGLEYSRLLISVPKRLFKRAVVRNLLKRRVREAYRTSKERLGGSIGVDLMFLYNTKQIMSSEEVLSAVREALDQIRERVLKKSENVV